MLRSEMNDEDRLASIPKTHKFVNTLDHEFMGRISVYQHYAGDNYIIMKEKVCNNKEHLLQEEVMVEKRDGLRHPNLMVLKDYSVRHTNKLCAEFFFIKTYFQYYLQNVENISIKKAMNGDSFTDMEIMQLTYDGIDVLSYLKTQGYNHGFIRPELMLIDEKGAFVLADRLMEGNALDAQKYCRLSGFDMYCSPIVWSNVVNHTYKESDIYKDDVFSFGLVLLRAALNHRVSEIYMPTGIIDQNRLHTLIEKAADKYEHMILFRQVLEKILAVDETMRADASMIKAGLPNREQIQLYFASEGDEIFFDGPKSQLLNSMMGKESILPSHVRYGNRNSSFRNSMNGSRVLAGLGGSRLRTSRHTSKEENIFGPVSNHHPAHFTNENMPPEDETPHVRDLNRPPAIPPNHMSGFPGNPNFAPPPPQRHTLGMNAHPAHIPGATLANSSPGDRPMRRSIGGSPLDAPIGYNNAPPPMAPPPGAGMHPHHMHPPGTPPPMSPNASGLMMNNNHPAGPYQALAAAGGMNMPPSPHPGVGGNASMNGQVSGSPGVPPHRDAHMAPMNPGPAPNRGGYAINPAASTPAARTGNTFAPLR